MLDEKLLNKQTFDLQSDRLLLKEIIKREFLAIEIWAVNDDNPNNNYSHFVAEDYAKSLPSFVNKPILGYFAQGDFKAHEGKVSKDEEMDITYWDNSKGEQILGFIRDKDKVEVREKEGKKWIVTTAVLWSNYNYHQIKKIIKDRHKKVSVEINVEDAYFTDLNGNMLKAIELKNDKTLIVKDEEGKELKYKYGTYIEHITQFDLSGITILGSKMGIPIKEGIEGASLSLLNEMEKAIFSRQQQALNFAYQKLDEQNESADASINFSKEDKGEMDIQDLTVESTILNDQTFASAPENVVDNEATVNEHGDTIVMAQQVEVEQQTNQEQERTEADDHQEHYDDNCPQDEDHDNGPKDLEHDCKNAEDPQNDDVQECKNAAEEAHPEDNCNNCKNAENNTEPATDDVENNCNNCMLSGDLDGDRSSDNSQPGITKEEFEELLSKYNESQVALNESQEALAAQEKKFAEQEEEFAKIKNDCDHYLEVTKQYEVELEELRKAVFTMTSEKRVKEACELMGHPGLTQEQRAAFLAKCKAGEYNESYDTLKKDIAIAYFDFNNGSSVSNNTNNDLTIAITSKPSSEKTVKTRKERMAEYANNK